MAAKKQLNFGLIDAVVVQEIDAKVQEFTSSLMNDGYGKLNKKQFMADFTEIAFPAFRKWMRTGLSQDESRREATREKVRKRMNEDINTKLKDLMKEILKIIDAKVEEVLEEYYGPTPSSS